MAMSLSSQNSVFGQNPDVAGVFGSGSNSFASPWLDLATLSMPDQNKNALEWCEYIWQSNGTYRMAQERKISYFLTDVEIGTIDNDNPIGDDEKEKWSSYLSETLGIGEVIKLMDMNREAYGNSFASLMVPFKRLLVCPKCFSQFPLREVARNNVFGFRWDKFEFHASCPKCSFRGTWLVNDQPEDLEKKLRVKIWSPHEIEILHDLYTDD